MSSQIRADLVLLQVEPFAPRESPPVDSPDVVTGRIRPVVRKIHRKPHVRRAVHPLKNPIHHMPRNDLEPAKALQSLRIQRERLRGFRSCRCSQNRLLRMNIFQ